jgi:hypothetical protein
MRYLAAAVLLFMFFGAPPALCARTEPAERTFTVEQLDQMLAPLALYPDDLLFTVLAAAAHPDDVAEAATFLRDHDGLRGDGLARAIDNETWDANVKALTQVPAVLDMLGAEREWTRALGQAFLGQQADVLDSIQYLRHQALAAGMLGSGDQQVAEEGDTIVIEAAEPGTVRMPYYDTTVVYGVWWWPSPPRHCPPPRFNARQFAGMKSLFFDRPVKVRNLRGSGARPDWRIRHGSAARTERRVAGKAAGVRAERRSAAAAPMPEIVRPRIESTRPASPREARWRAEPGVGAASAAVPRGDARGSGFVEADAGRGPFLPPAKAPKAAPRQTSAAPAPAIGRGASPALFKGASR